MPPPPTTPRGVNSAVGVAEGWRHQHAGVAAAAAALEGRSRAGVRGGELVELALPRRLLRRLEREGGEEEGVL